MGKDYEGFWAFSNLHFSDEVHTAAHNCFSRKKSESLRFSCSCTSLLRAFGNTDVCVHLGNVMLPATAEVDVTGVTLP